MKCNGFVGTSISLCVAEWLIRLQLHTWRMRDIYTIYPWYISFAPADSEHLGIEQ